MTAAPFDRRVLAAALLFAGGLGATAAATNDAPALDARAPVSATMRPAVSLARPARLVDSRAIRLRAAQARPPGLRRVAVAAAPLAASAVPRGERRYVVEVDEASGVDPAAFATFVDRTLADPRGWSGLTGATFRRVGSGPVDFRVTLAAPDLTDVLCDPLGTEGRLSCFHAGRAVINASRWAGGSATYGADLASYRQYVVNHEVGHALGLGHRQCPGPGRPAPVMVQQTKGLGGCRANPWPSLTGG